MNIASVLFVSLLLCAAADRAHRDRVSAGGDDALHLRRTIVFAREKDIIPEGIAADDRTGLLYVGSMARHKVIEADTAGNSRDFVSINDGRPGYTDISGVKVDKARGWLWFVSTYIENKWYTAQLQAYGLTDRTLKKRFTIRDTIKHIFNDLVLSPDGKIYVTDTYFGAVYEADPATDRISVLIHDTLSALPNGIALTPNRQLYIATYSHGLLLYDLASRQLSQLTGYRDREMVYNLDGLYYKEHSLFAVYNSARHKKKNSLLEYVLTRAGTKIIEEKKIDQGNPLFRKPTTIAFMGNDLYLLAVTNIDEYNENHDSVRGIEDRLLPLRMMVYSRR